MTLAELRRMFDRLCKEHDVTQNQIIRPHGNARIREARTLIMQEMRRNGAKVWQIQYVIPRDQTTIRHNLRLKLDQSHS